ncbi:MAG: phosphate uptake regulator PhoU [Thermoproteus sp.]
MRRLLDLAEAEIAKMLSEGAERACALLDAAVRAYAEGGPSSPLRDAASELHKLHDSVAELVLEAVARFSPMATDLRFMRAALFASYDIYRIARYAYDIAAAAERLGGGCPSQRVAEVASHVKSMLTAAVYMLTNRDLSRYEEVKNMDDEVDRAYEAAIDSLLRRVDRCAVLEAMALRLLERASDHAVYIANHSKYLVTGELAH